MDDEIKTRERKKQIATQETRRAKGKEYKWGTEDDGAQLRKPLQPVEPQRHGILSSLSHSLSNL